MEIGIIGFQTSGKTTIFNALTGAEAPVSAFATGKAEPNLAVVSVPDLRLDRLAELYQPKKTTHAAIQCVDLAGIDRGRNEVGEGLGETQIHAIGACDALLAVIRGFPNAAGEPPDLQGDAEAIALEMTLSDLKKVENRLERLAKLKGKIAGDEGKRNELELAALERLKPILEDGRPVRDGALSVDEEKILRGFQFLTQKPLLLLANMSDDALSADGDPAEPIRSLGEAAGVSVTWMAGRAEMEIASLAPEERGEFLAEYGIEEPASAKIIRLLYELLGLISFITVGPDECRAWTIRSGTPAAEAAGAIHTDLQRGFIRGEVCRWDELLEAGSLPALKKQGKLRVEGKAYEVRDGEVFHVLFSV